MEIDKSKLKLGIWYEDENGNLIKSEDDLACEAPEGARTYHSCFPLQITEHVYVVRDVERRYPERTYVLRFLFW